MNKINLLLPLILLAFQTNAASTYLFTLDKNIAKNAHIVDITDIYDENGFLPNGTHQNGTLYDDNGFDINGNAKNTCGFDISGGTYELFAFGNTNKGNMYKDGIMVKPWSFGSSAVYDGFLYTRGELKGSALENGITGQSGKVVYEICWELISE